ncbi:MAG: type II/IV secretion system protein [Candidatus Carbobacillus altaicus]|nr:type II/IV secretion system protein [Candidatus Carbobacillus altaicus]
MVVPARKRLEIFCRRLITEDILQAALDEQKKTKERLGDILLKKGWLTQDALYGALERQLGYERLQLSRRLLPRYLAALIPETVAEKYQVIPYEQEGHLLRLAMVDPLDYYAIEDVEMMTGLDVRPALITYQEFTYAFARLYGPRDENLDAITDGVSFDESALNEDEIYDENSPIVRFVHETVERAVRLGASDVHIDPQASGALIRYRVDGVLRRVQTINRQVLQMVAARIKIISGLNIAERRKPQDGRYRQQVDFRDIDIRVSILPTMHGEKVVLRLLDQSRGVKQLEELGLSQHHYRQLVSLSEKSNGIILVTGPTGSGKSTTLYAILKRLHTEQKNIITIEDPVEYEIEGINQVQVNAQAGLTFASGLRAILRQDPNIIMVGEIRDLETAEIAIRASLTGHLVLSTLHTNNALGAIDRLRDMGIPTYLLAASVNGLMAQRLVRRICTDCRRTRAILEEERLIFEQSSVPVPEVLEEGAGCDACGHTGYRGRLAVHEIIVLDRPLKRMIADGEPTETMVEYARREGMRSLWDNALDKVRQGETTLEEVLAEIGASYGDSD